MNNFLKISLFIVAFSLSSCYTTFKSVDIYSDDTPTSAYLEQVNVWSSILGITGGFFTSSFLFDDFFTRMLFSSIEYVPNSAPAYYHGYNDYNPYGYGYSYTFITYNFWYYPPYYHHWKSPYYSPKKKDILYAARNFKKRIDVPGGEKIKRTRAAREDSELKRQNNEKNAFYTSSRVKRVRTTHYTGVIKANQAKRVNTPTVKTRNRSATAAASNTSQPKNTTKEQRNNKSKKSDSSVKRDNDSNTRTRRR